MSRTHCIKDLTRRAIDLVKACYVYSHSNAPCWYGPEIPAPEALAQHHSELFAFLKSPEATGAVPLANLAIQLALVRRLPTLLLVTRYSPTLFAFNLVLHRAGIQPQGIFDVCWTKAVFARLSAAARATAGSPLLVVGSPIVNISWRMLLCLPAKHRNRRIITDAGPDAIPHLQKISCAFGLPITTISVTR